MPKFSPGDPVWARVWDAGFAVKPLGEHVATVLHECDCARRPRGYEINYHVDIAGHPAPDGWGFRESNLRPRRDDYQQHEPLGTRADLGKVFREEVEKEVTSAA